MENITLDEDEELVSFDVKAFFTSILLEEAIKICEQRSRDDVSLAERTQLTADTVIRLLRFCLMNSSFQYNGVHYRQKDGIAMGSPVSQAIADIFMNELESRAFAKYPEPPRLWKPFVDDVLSIVRRG